jgi:hypothetical protein
MAAGVRAYSLCLGTVFAVLAVVRVAHLLGWLG